VGLVVVGLPIMAVGLVVMTVELLVMTVGLLVVTVGLPVGLPVVKVVTVGKGGKMRKNEKAELKCTKSSRGRSS
jgi:hypothetical protein